MGELSKVCNNAFFASSQLSLSLTMGAQAAALCVSTDNNAANDPVYVKKLDEDTNAMALGGNLAVDGNVASNGRIVLNAMAAVLDHLNGGEKEKQKKNLELTRALEALERFIEQSKQRLKAIEEELKKLYETAQCT